METAPTPFLPKIGRATSIVTLPVQSHDAPLDKSLYNAVTNPLPMTCDGGPSSILPRKRLHDAGAGKVLSSSSSESCRDWPLINTRDKRNTASHAHLLVSPQHLRSVAFPIICIAEHDEIYEVLSSALFHRRALGVLDPVLGFTYDPAACYLHLVIAWLAPVCSGTHDCVSVIYTLPMMLRA